MTTTNTVFHDIRGNNIFLAIKTPSDIREASRVCYSVERQIPSDATRESILALIKEMEAESGLSLTPSSILREELGL